MEGALFTMGETQGGSAFKKHGQLQKASWKMAHVDIMQNKYGKSADRLYFFPSVS